ncbi:MAG: hypothetical protein JSR37_00490 [Verrucomicrobia bacterium]|nr:hypothetical protein [Verrucomicrobiota bacterium]MBS0635954.1 hypothetical protein [Verrucomicrobiota bacterium]
MTLCLKEKLAVSAMLLLLATFAATSFSNKQQKFNKTTKTLKVSCLGAVVDPHEVEIAYGTTLADVLAHFTLSPDADITKMVLEEPVKHEKLIIVPSKGVMTLYITGAVKQPGVIFVPESLRFNQLKEYLILTDNADSGIFSRRRRQLSEGETVHVPAKSEYFTRK